MGKKQRKGRVEITLKKSGVEDIVIKSCPEKIKMGIFRTYIEMRFGIPSMDVKPIDWKGTGIILGTYIAAFLFLGIFYGIEFPIPGIIIFIAFIIANGIITKNYYFNFIRKKISDGYEPATEEQKQILLNAGIYANNAKQYTKKKEDN